VGIYLREDYMELIGSQSNMDKKSLDKLVEEARQQWKHIPSFSGKQVKRNYMVLRSLIVNVGGLSCWDLAKKYLEATEKNWKRWDKTKSYGARVIENSNMNKRLKVLREKEYVKKTGSIYHITAKGWWLGVLMDTNIVKEVSSKRLMVKLPGALQIPKHTENFSENVIKKVLSLNDNYTDEEGASKTRELLLRVLQNNDSRALLIFQFKRLLKSLKINVDEMPSEDFMALFYTRLEKIAKKRGIKF